jgi:hypothetical protein
MLKSFYLFIILLLSVTGCKLEDPEIPNEEELITTMHFRLSPAGGGTPITLSFKDLDGDGGSAPVITSGNLIKNTTYLGELELLNEQQSPPVNISTEIKNEGEEHQFFFHTTGNLGITVQYDDQDSQGNPIGLKNKLITSGASTGKLTITLRHEPDKSAPGVFSGNIANAGGETDIEITFDVEVE